MNRKTIIIMCLVVVLVFFSGLAILYTRNIIKDSKDYTKAFPLQATKAVQHTITYYKNLEVDTTVDIISTPEPQFSETEDHIVNLLFLGIDRTEDRDDEFMGVYRTDTIIFVSINLKTGMVEALSIPRDSYVYIPIVDKKDKINHAYVWGGMKKEGINSTIATVNNFIKYKKVDYYFAMDREPVAKIIDAFGGVEIDVDEDLHNEFADISKGHQLLDGENAEAYIKFRDSANGDIDRIKRQHKFLKAIYEKIKIEGNVIKDLKLFLSFNKYMQTDLSYTQMLALANFFMDIPEDNIHINDTPGYGQYIDGISYWIPDEEAVQVFQ